MKFLGNIKNGAVLQRDKEIIINGTADEDKLLCVLKGGSYFEEWEVTPDANGKFKVEFSPVSDIKNRFTLGLYGETEKIEVSVRFGDVFLTLGQSNMSYGVGAMYNRSELIEKAKKCDVSFFNIFEADVKENGEIFRPAKPQDDFAKEWRWITPQDENFGETSAVAVIAAIELFEETGVPVAMVNTALGGVSIDTYMPRYVADEDERIFEYLKKIDKYIPKDGEYNVYGGANYSQLGGIYNEKIYPLKDNRFKAMMWYQGENAIGGFEGAAYFEIALRKIIETYQKLFGKDTYFVATNVALDYYDYGEYGYNYINEAIDRAVKGEYACSFPAYDASTEWKVNDGATYYHPIHPVNKDLISHRFAKAILSELYNNKTWIPPYIRDVQVKEGKVYASIYPEKNFRYKNVYGFTVAGEDGKFVEAECNVIGKGQIEVFSPYVSNPVEITYAFSPYNSRCNLITTDGDAVKTYRKRFEDVSERMYLPLNAFGNCSETYFDEKNFGADLGCIGKAEIFKDGQITRTRSTKRKIVGKTGEKRLKIEYNPTNDGYYFFGVSPEINIACTNPHFERFDYLSVEIKVEGDEEVEFHGALVKIHGGAIRRFIGNEPVVKASGDFKEYRLSLKTFMTPSLAQYPAGEDERKSINEFELYFRSKTKGVLYIKSIRLHD